MNRRRALCAMIAGILMPDWLRRRRKRHSQLIIFDSKGNKAEVRRILRTSNDGTMIEIEAPFDFLSPKLIHYGDSSWIPRGLP